MAWRSEDYEPSGGWHPPDWAVMWSIWLVASLLFSGALYTFLPWLPGTANALVGIASVGIGFVLGAAVVKPWRS